MSLLPSNALNADGKAEAFAIGAALVVRGSDGKLVPGIHERRQARCQTGAITFLLRVADVAYVHVAIARQETDFDGIPVILIPRLSLKHHVFNAVYLRMPQAVLAIRSIPVFERNTDYLCEECTGKERIKSFRHHLTPPGTP
jgi:hypothetical protein